MLPDRFRTHLGICVLIAGASILPLPVRTLAEDQEEAGEPRWPREIDAPEAEIVVYQPQLESFAGNKLTARAAVSVTPKGATDPVFGAAWFKCKVETDRDSRMVTLVDLEVAEAKFPNTTPEQLEKLGRVLQTELTKQAHPVSLDRILTALKLADQEKAAADQLNTKPPKILFVKHPAVLVLIDGRPALRGVEHSKVMRVVNTPFLILLEPESKSYYLRGGDDWFIAKDINGPWRVADNPPSSITALVTKEADAAPASDERFSKAGGMPQIIVATEPTELISSDGEPQYSPIADTGLLYMSNTESDVFMEIASQHCFVLLSGRWYSSKSMDGPWSYVPADKLPGDFAKIPAGSEKGYVRAHVAGTDEAEEAVQETYIPQTARIERKKATLKVDYDGAPRFKAIAGTEMEYAENSASDVIRVGSRYYCCNEGVWFVADVATGPWIVCDSVPQVIYTLPPECPVYPVKYVQVYESTPEYVFVGYTPGYVGCYPFYGTVVYGTGFYYPGWYGAVYYPRPATWGFGFHYNPFTGNWGVRAGYAGPNGWVAFGYRDGKFYQGFWAAGGVWGHGWWGHGGLHPMPSVRGGVGINRIDMNNRWAVEHRQNIYNRPGNIDRNALRPAGADRSVAGRHLDASVRSGTGQPTRLGGAPVRTVQSGLANDVYADRNGNVYRRTEEGWQRRTGNNWSRTDLGGQRVQSGIDRATPARRPSDTGFQRSAPQGRPSYVAGGYSAGRADLDRQSYARDRGAYRTDSFQRYSSSPGSGSFRSGGGAGFRGGGRR